MGILDDAAKTLANPQATPAATNAAPTGAPQGGSALDQAVAQQTAGGQQTAAQTAPPVESTTDRWKREAYETIGKVLPQAILPTGEAAEKDVLQPAERMGKETGNIAERKINTMLPYLSDEIGQLEGDKAEFEPTVAPSLRAAQARLKFEKDNPWVSGISGGVANLAGQVLGNPTNWPFLVKSIAKTAITLPAEAIAPWAEKLISKGFGIQMSAGAVSQLDELAGNWKGMSDYDKSKAITQVVAGTYMAQSALREGFKRSEERRVGKECRSRWSPYH